MSEEELISKYDAWYPDANVNGNPMPRHIKIYAAKLRMIRDDQPPQTKEQALAQVERARRRMNSIVNGS